MDEKDKNIKVSIVVPVYNVEKYIVECLNSVAMQTYQGQIECIVVDDCGTDNSVRLAEEFVNAYEGSIVFKICYREKNGGLSAARNSGTDVATGDYIYYLDSDDYILPNSIDDLVAIAKQYPCVDVIQGGIIDTNGKEIFNSTKSIPFSVIKDRNNALKFYLLPGRMPVSAWNKLYKLSLIQQNHVRFYEGIIFEDVDFSFKLSHYLGSLAFCNKLTYVYRAQRPGSILNTLDGKKSALNSLIIYKSQIERINSSSPRILYKTLFLYMQGNLRALPVNEEVQVGYKHLSKDLCKIATGLDKIMLLIYFLLPHNVSTTKIVYRLYRKYFSM